MRCVICGGRDIKDKEVEEELKVGKGMILLLFHRYEMEVAKETNKDKRPIIMDNG